MYHYLVRLIGSPWLGFLSGAYNMSKSKDITRSPYRFINVLFSSVLVGVLVYLLAPLALGWVSSIVGPYMNFGLKEVFSTHNVIVLLASGVLLNARKMKSRHSSYGVRLYAWCCELLNHVVAFQILQLLLAFMFSFSKVNFVLAVLLPFSTESEGRSLGDKQKVLSIPLVVFSIVNIILAVNMSYPLALSPQVLAVARRLFVPTAIASVLSGALSLKFRSTKSQPKSVARPAEAQPQFARPAEVETRGRRQTAQNAQVRQFQPEGHSGAPPPYSAVYVNG